MSSTDKAPISSVSADSLAPIDFDDRFEIDEETGELLGPKLTPYQLALNAGVDWYKGLDTDDLVDEGIVEGASL